MARTRIIIHMFIYSSSWLLLFSSTKHTKHSFIRFMKCGGICNFRDRELHTYVCWNILRYVCIITTNSCRLPSSKSFNVIITNKIRHHTLSKKIIILRLWEIELIRDWEKCPYAYKATLKLIKGLPMNLWDFFEELFVWQGLWTNKKGEYAIFFRFWIFVNEKIYFWYFAKLIKNRKGKFYSNRIFISIDGKNKNETWNWRFF